MLSWNKTYNLETILSWLSKNYSILSHWFQNIFFWLTFKLFLCITVGLKFNFICFAFMHCNNNRKNFNIFITAFSSEELSVFISESSLEGRFRTCLRRLRKLSGMWPKIFFHHWKSTKLSIANKRVGREVFILNFIIRNISSAIGGLKCWQRVEVS